MKLIVNPHRIQIDSTPVNEKELNVTKVQFEFAEEITNDFVKEAYFTTKGNSYKQIIINNECNIPSEVLTEKGQIEIGVVAYLVEDETEIKRYNPSPVFISTLSGSLKDAENTEPITPSEMEQFEQALQVGLNAIGDAIEDASTLDIDATKTGNVATITITKQDGTTKEVEITDGEDGEPGQQGIPGTPGKDGKDGKDGSNGTDGYSPSASVNKVGSVATITIIDKTGTTTTTINDGANGQNGRDGVDGNDGADGFSPLATVSKSGNTATISITDKNGTTTAEINDGINGTNGRDGTDGTNGTDGVSLQYDWDGTKLGIKREDESNYQYVDLKGDTGASGQDGQDGQDGYSPTASVSKNGSIATITITDKNGTTTTTVSDGQNGTNGTNGSDGYSPIANVSKSGSVTTISITDSVGTTTATVNDGTNGTNGQDGADGFSPIANVIKSGNTATITITDKNGTTTAQISDGAGSSNDLIQIKKSVAEPISFAAGYTLIPLETTVYSKGNSLTEQNGKVKIGAGVSKVKISGACNFYNAYQSTGLEIRKNDTDRIILCWSYAASTNVDITATIPDFYANVEENDLISFYVYRGTARTINVQDPTFITVEAVE